MQELTSLRSEALERVKRSRIFSRLETGLDRGTYAAYLVDVYQYAQHSAKVIALAGSRAVSSHPALAAYLMRHGTEEIGHEQWAYSDLRKLGLAEEAIRASRPGTACASMIGLEYFVAGHWNPVALFGWMFVLESLGDDIGHFAAQRIGRALDDSSATYFLAGHGDADHDHAREITETIQKHMTDPADVADTLHVARVARDLYLGILDEAIARGPQWA